MSLPLSVVVPVHNEAPHLAATVTALLAALDGSGFDAELVVVDDGSTDGSLDVAREAVGKRIALRAVTQERSGRFAARRAGIEAAGGEWVLLLDARVRLSPDALVAVYPRLEAGERVWNGHVHVEAAGNPYGMFGEILVALAWRDYFARPRETSFDASDFDRYPKGTTCFLAPRELLRSSLDAYRSRYADLRHANDDTPVIRWIAARERIHLSPAFACTYEPRSSLGAFVRHSFHRGVVFVDGHGRAESRFFPAVVVFYPLSAAAAALAARRPELAAGAAAAGAVAAAAIAAAAGRTASESASFGALAPVYAVAHGAGMWRALWLLLRQRLAATPA